MIRSQEREGLTADEFLLQKRYRILYYGGQEAVGMYCDDTRAVEASDVDATNLREATVLIDLPWSVLLGGLDAHPCQECVRSPMARYMSSQRGTLEARHSKGAARVRNVHTSKFPILHVRPDRNWICLVKESSFNYLENARLQEYFL